MDRSVVREYPMSFSFVTRDQLLIIFDIEIIRTRDLGEPHDCHFANELWPKTTKQMSILTENFHET